MPAGGSLGSWRRNRCRPDGPGTRLVGDFGIAVDDDVAEISQQSGGAIPARRETEEGWSLGEERRRGQARLKRFVIDQIVQKRDVGLDAADTKLAQGSIHALASFRERASPGRHFDQKRIVIRRDHRAAVGRCAVETNPEAGRRAIGVNPAVVGQEVVRRIFGRNAALQRVAIQRHVVLRRQRHFRTVQLVALRDLNLGAHNVDAGHHFRDGMLHLHARVHFDEIPIARIGVHQELDRSGVVVSGGPGEFHGRIGEALANVCRPD